MPHQTKPGDPVSYSYGHNLGDYPEIGQEIAKGNKPPSLADIAKMRGQTLVGTTIVDTKDADSFINQQNQIGVSGGVNQINPNLGTLGQYIPQAQTIFDTLYSKSPEEQEREDRINTGMMMLNFFTKMGAEASRPGATALGAANVAGADTASMYIKQVNAERARRDAEKKGVVNLASQLMGKKTTPGASKDFTVKDFRAVNKALKLSTPVKNGQTISLNPSQLALLPIGSVIGLSTKKGQDEYVPIYKDGRVENILKNSPDYVNKITTGGYSIKKPDDEKRVPIYKNDGTSEMVIENSVDYKTKLDSGEYTTDKPPAKPAPLKPNPFEKLRIDVMNVVTKYVDNENVISPEEATIFGSSIFRLQKDNIRTIDGEDGQKQTIVEEGLDLLSILKQSYGEEKINNLLIRMGITPSSKTPIADQINEKNKNEITPKEKEISENGDTTEYNVLKVGNKKIRVLSKKKEKMSKELVVSLANASGALKDLNRATQIFFPNGKYNSTIALQTSILGSNSLGDARIAFQSMKRAIEVILRLRTGAAAPKEEVQSYLDQFMPGILDGQDGAAAEIKLNALIDFFEAVTKGINEGRRPDDKTWVRRPNSNAIKDVLKDGGQLNDGRKIKIIRGVPHIQKEKDSDVYVPIK